MRFVLLLMILALAATGCTTRAQARAQAREQAHDAYLAGQNQVLQQALQGEGVTVLGPVQNSQVPWVAGLTLTQAIATANYQDPNPPKEIILTRDGESATLDPSILLNGAVVPLEPGDTVELRP